MQVREDKRYAAMQGHCEADTIPADSARNRPCDSAGFAGCQRRGTSRVKRLTALLAVALLGANMPVGITGESLSVQSPPFAAHAHVPSATISHDNHVPDLRKKGAAPALPAAHIKIGDRQSKNDCTTVQNSNLKWPDMCSPVSEAESPPLRAATPSAEFSNLVKGLKGVQLPSSKNLKMLSEQLDLESVSVEVEEAVEAAVVEAKHSSAGTLGLDIGWSSIPHPLKVARGGEDSHIIARLHGATLLGVFDGVGGWAELGVDPAEYARKLGRLVEAALSTNPDILKDHDRPLLTLLTKAFQVLEEEELAGSCTASLALLTDAGKLHVLNIGDSGIHVIRSGKCVFKTGDQQHYFNCPFQLGMGSDDRPTDAEYYVLEDLEPDDVIVAATDGVWDNLYEAELLEMTQPSTIQATPSDATTSHTNTPELLARAISEASHLHGKDDKFVSPFSVNAARHGLSFTGGKLDDVTVVVSRVCDITPSSAEQKEANASKNKVSKLSIEKRPGSVRTSPLAVGGVNLDGDEYGSPVSSAESNE